MRMFIAFATGAALLTTAATAEAAVHSSAKANSTLSADAMWAKVGDFCGISQWHPAIEKCELSADGKQRTLSLKGGGTVVEKLVKMDAAHRSYTYAIINSPLPVSHYRSTLSVKPHGKGSTVSWTGKFDAKGASDADAKKTMDGVYDAGVKALTAN